MFLSFSRLTNHLYLRAVLIAQISMVLGLWEELKTLFLLDFVFCCTISDAREVIETGLQE